MKKYIYIMIAILFTFALFGCNKKSDEVPAVNEAEYPTLSATEIPVTQIPAPTTTPNEPTPIPDPAPVEREPYSLIRQGNYIFIDGKLVGCFADGQWISAKETNFSVAGLLMQDAFYCYDQGSRMGKSTKVSFSYDGGLSYSFKYWGNDHLMLIPYADEHDEEMRKIIFDLPRELPEDVYDVVIMNYNTPVDFGVVDYPWDISLAMSSNFNPLPGSVMEVEKPTKEDIEAVAKELEKLGVPGATANITQIYECDLSGSGEKERIIFANMPRAQSWHPFVSQEEVDNGNSGYYYVLLIKDKNGYDTVTSWCYPYSSVKDFQKYLSIEPGGYSFYTDAIRGIYFSGIFDLNHDGVFELCIDEGCYESGRVLVFAPDERGKWQQVLRGEYGM